MVQPNDDEYIFGRNVLLAFLEQACQDNNNLPLDKIFIAQGLQPDKRLELIKNYARKQAVPVIQCDKQQLERLVGAEARHQGVVGRISQIKTLTLSDFLSSLSIDKNQISQKIFIAVVDGIQDPQNLGAIIRVAQAAGAKCLITSNRRSAGTTGAVAKASAGALARLPIVKVKNLVAAIDELKTYGFWIAGLSASASQNVFNHDLRLPLAIVIGSEGDGLSRLVEKHCDFLLSIPMSAGTESLNAAVAAGIVFYEYVRQNLAKSV